MQITIVANGKISDLSALRDAIQAADQIIAVDGGANYLFQLDLYPNLVIGDMDSISEDVIQRFSEHNVKTILQPVDKDATDLELAIDYAINKNPAVISIWGALGNRWDMSISNVLLLTPTKYRFIRIILEDEKQSAMLLQAGQPNRLKGVKGSKISLIPLCGDVTRVTTEGLKYPLASETLFFGRTRGVSNVFKETEAVVLFEEGILLCVIAKHCLEN